MEKYCSFPLESPSNKLKERKLTLVVAMTPTKCVKWICVCVRVLVDRNEIDLLF